MFDKGDIVEVIQIDEGKRESFNKYLGGQFKVRGIASSVWRHIIFLEPINEKSGLEGWDEKIFLQQHGWNAQELKFIERV
jgi:hypothetical protein